MTLLTDNPARSLDAIVEQLVHDLANGVSRGGAELDTERGDLASLAIWAKVDARVRAQHIAFGLNTKKCGRSWKDLARVAGLSTSSSAESRYTGKGPIRSAEARMRKAAGLPPLRKLPKSVIVDDIDWI